MDAVLVTPPGRFPTVDYDPGEWWSQVCGDSRVSTRRFSANAAWWSLVCSPDVTSFCATPPDLKRRERLRLSGSRARAALDALRRPETYRSTHRFIGVVRDIMHHLSLLDEVQGELTFGLQYGAALRGITYADSRELVEASAQDTLLTRLVARALAELRDPDLIFLPITCPGDLLTGLIAVQALRRRNQSVYACLVDHGCENFSLGPYLPTLRTAGTLDSVFDSIVESKDEREKIVPRLVDEVVAGRRPRGYLRAGDLPAGRATSDRAYRAPQPVPTFASEPVSWTRISPRRCYWSRCTFCVHNAKYDDGRAPSLAAIPRAVERLRAMRAAGYRTFLFSDEALSPAMLNHLSRAIIDARLDIRWMCRSKLERAFDRPLFEQLHSSGCYEILFGLESTSQRVLRMMDKEVPGLDASGVEAVFEAATAVGIGLHVTLIANFPGERFDEFASSLQYLARILSGRRRHTYSLNRFVVFPGTRVFDEPERFGIAISESHGDMPGTYDYSVTDGSARDAAYIDQALPFLRDELADALGWSAYGSDAGTEAAIDLYFQSGIGAVMRSSSQNPFVRGHSTNARDLYQ